MIQVVIQVLLFYNKPIYDEQGVVSNNWSPLDNFSIIDDKSRNTYSVSFIFSQILDKDTQIHYF